MNQRNLYLIALALTKGLGPVSVKNLIAYCGSAKAVFEASKGKLKRAPGIGEVAAKLVQESHNLQRAEKEMNFCLREDIEIITYLDEDYPQRLKYIHNAPLLLFKKGEVNFNAQPNIAIVGTRRATDYGRALTEKFASHFAERGINVVSGLAYGIDITAHRSVLKNGGITTAVLAHGLDRIYPSNHHRKAMEMLSQGGIVTEYLTGTDPDAPHFPARNRIVSGISRAVIVIEAAERGGALITAKLAFDQNREVYAIPGRIGDRYSQGCNNLIRDNIAKLVSSPEEVLADLDIQWQEHTDQTRQLELALAAPEIPLNVEEAKVMNLLNQGEALVDQITVKTGIPVNRLNALLLSMEFKNLLRQLPGKIYQRI